MCYFAIDTELAWEAANSICQQVGYHFAKIESDGDSESLAALMDSATSYWIGAQLSTRSRRRRG